MDRSLLDEDWVVSCHAILLDPSETRARFRLYPLPFVESLQAITNKGFSGRRLDRESWARFQDDVFRAYKETVTPLLSSPV